MWNEKAGYCPLRRVRIDGGVCGLDERGVGLNSGERERELDLHGHVVVVCAVRPWVGITNIIGRLLLLFLAFFF